MSMLFLLCCKNRITNEGSVVQDKQMIAIVNSFNSNWNINFLDYMLAIM